MAQIDFDQDANLLICFKFCFKARFLFLKK